MERLIESVDITREGKYKSKIGIGGAKKEQYGV
jgi:hypothetical protein